MTTTEVITMKTEIWDFAEQVLSSAHAHTVFMWGPPGVGKTYTAMRIGLDGREVFSVTLTPETPAAELRGFWMPKGTEFVWTDGVFIEAMRKGARVVINEISHASHDVMAILYPVLESRETAALTLPSGETVYPANGFQVICTDNLGPDRLPRAVQDRFKAMLHIETPHPKAMNRLSRNYRELAQTTMMDMDDESREVGLRAWLSVQDFEKDLGQEGAFRAVFGEDRGQMLYQAMILKGTGTSEE